MVQLLEELEAYAKENNVPIMEHDGIEFLIDYIKKNNIKRILEVGSAIGYSAIKMALVDSDISVFTIERDKERYDLAVQNIEKFNLNNRITIINMDAHDTVVEGTFDLIFIDAAKSSYIRFFEKYKDNLNENGVIITDNLNFHGLVNEEIKSRNLRQLVTKINKYVLFLKENNEFVTDFFEIGDGISISKRKWLNV